MSAFTKSVLLFLFLANVGSIGYHLFQQIYWFRINHLGQYQHAQDWVIQFIYDSVSRCTTSPSNWLWSEQRYQAIPLILFYLQTEISRKTVINSSFPPLAIVMVLCVLGIGPASGLFLYLTDGGRNMKPSTAPSITPGQSWSVIAAQTAALLIRQVKSVRGYESLFLLAVFYFFCCMIIFFPPRLPTEGELSKRRAKSEVFSFILLGVFCMGLHSFYLYDAFSYVEEIKGLHEPSDQMMFLWKMSTIHTAQKVLTTDYIFSMIFFAFAAMRDIRWHCLPWIFMMPIISSAGTIPLTMAVRRVLDVASSTSPSEKTKESRAASAVGKIEKRGQHKTKKQ